MLMQRKAEKAKKTAKSVPKVALGAKGIQAEKKTMKVIDDDGKEITMEEMLERSKEKGAGKGGRGTK